MQNLDHHIKLHRSRFIFAMVGAVLFSVLMGFDGEGGRGLAEGFAFFLSFTLFNFIIYVSIVTVSFLRDWSETKAHAEWQQSLLRAQTIMDAIKLEGDQRANATYANARDELYAVGVRRGWLTP